MVPTLLRIGLDSQQSNFKIDQLGATTLLGMAIFGILGGVVAWIWGETDLKKVFYLGLGLPSLLTVGTASGSAPASTSATPSGNSTGLLRMITPSVVFAANPPVAGRMLKVALPPEVVSAQPQAVFELGTGEQAVPLTSGVAISVPQAANSVLIHCSLGSSAEIRLPESPGVLLSLKVSAEKNTWYGFKYAVGLHSDQDTLTASPVQGDNVLGSVTVVRPIALGYSAGTGLLALQADGGVVAIQGNAARAYGKIPVEFAAVDLSAATVAGMARAFVLGLTGQGTTAISSVFLFTGAGTTPGNFMGPPGSGTLGGITVDANGGVVYATNSAPREIDAWNIAATSLSARRFIAGIAQAKSLAAVAFDPTGKQLFAADPNGGKVYSMQLGGKHEVKEFFSRAESVSALAVDDSARQVFIGGGSKLVRVAINTPSQTKTVVSGARNISGLAVDGDHHLWVGDSQLNLVEQLIP